MILESNFSLLPCIPLSSLRKDSACVFQISSFYWELEKVELLN